MTRQHEPTGQHLLKIARYALEAFLTTGLAHEPEAKTFSDDYYGLFVTLRTRDHELRGCIGMIEKIESALEEVVVEFSIKAAIEDPRFDAMQKHELDLVYLEVSLLHKPQKAELTDLDPLKYGIIVKNGWRRGVLLPNIEGIETAKEQIFIAKKKAGIAPPENVEIERFLVTKFSEIKVD